MKNVTRSTRTIAVIAFIFGGLFFLSRTAGAAVSSTNLITNPSVEISGADGLPTGWQTDQWGANNASLTYQNVGSNSLHSLSITMTGYVDGDAKWYFNPVAVEPETDYTFSDFYRADVPTSLVAMSLDAAGNATYFDISAEVASSSSWKKTSYAVRTLVDTKTLTVLHLLTSNGRLETDRYSLVKNAPVPVVDFIANNSAEIISPVAANTPEGWTKSSWGENSPTYLYPTNGNDGSRSLRIVMRNYLSGDAKWMPMPSVLERGKDYRFTVWYKTNTKPHVAVQFIRDDGTEDYFGMPDPEPNGTGWQQYSDTFSVPINVKSATAFMFLSSNGWLQTDDYHILPYAYSGFDKGRVTLTFDDGFEKNISSVLPVINQYGFKVTNCYATQYIKGLPEQIDNVKKFSAQGNETCSHTVTHPYLTDLTVAQMDQELNASKTFLEKITGTTVTGFASPYGSYNSKVNQEIAKYYQAHRTTDEGFNSKDNLNPYRLRVQNMLASTTVQQFQDWVTKAQETKTWLIIVYHAVDSQDLGEYDTYKPDFDQEMAWLAASGVTVERMDKALSEVMPQK